MTTQEFSSQVKQKYPEYKDIPDDKLVNAVLKKYPEYASQVNTGAITERPQSNGQKALNAVGSTALDIGKALITAPARVASTAMGAVEGAGSLGGAAISSLAGDKAGAQKQINQASQALKTGGAFGQATGFTPVGVTLDDEDKTIGEKVTSGIRDIVGTGMELGTTVIPAGKALGVSKKALAGLGALSGGGSALGTAIREGTPLPEAALSTAIGTGLGIATGGVLGKAAPKIAKAPLAQKAVSEAGQQSSNILRNIGATAKGVGESVAGRVSRTIGSIGESVKEAGELSLKAPEIQDAIKVGVPREMVDALTSLSPTMKQKTKQMLDIGTGRMGQYFKGRQPKEVVGEEIVNRITPVVKARKALGEAVDKTRSKVPLKAIDVTDEYQALVNTIKQAGARVSGDGFTLKESGGSIPKATLKKMSEVLKTLKPNAVTGRTIRSAKYLDAQRQKFFKMYKDSLTTDKPFTPEAIKFVDEMRALLGKRIDTLSNGYMKAQTDYAELMGVLQKIVKNLGLTDEELKMIGLDDLENLDAVALRASEKAMRTLGNAAAQQKAFLGELTEAAGKYGYREDVDLDQLIQLSNDIEKITGSTQDRSLAGQVSRGVREGGQGLINETLEGLRTGGAIGGTISAITKVGAPGSKEQIEALRKLLK